MLFTRECDYAVRILRALSGGGVVSVQDICALEDLSVSITYKITRKLEKSGILKSFRGTNGGYALNRPLNDLTLLEVFTAVDSQLLVTECTGSLGTGHSHSCSRNTADHPCLVHAEFLRIQSLLIKELNARPLSQIIKG